MAAATSTTSWTLLWFACLVVRAHGQPVHTFPDGNRNGTRTVAIHYSDEVETVYPKPVSSLMESSSSSGPDEEDDKCRAILYVSISPLLSKDRPPRLAEVSWDYANCGVTPRRAVAYRRAWDEKPATSLDQVEIVWSAYLPGIKGRVLTNYTVERGSEPSIWKKDVNDALKVPGDFCMDFRVALLDHNGRILDTQCMKIQPTWMQRLEGSRLSSLLVTEMMLPGTHNSLCYSREADFESNMVRYLLTQDLSFWEQLIFGVRYFDIRVGYYPQDMGDQQNADHPDHGQKFWVNHDMVRIQPLVPLLQELRYFLTYATAEIVVLDFHRFPVGFGSSDDSDDPHPQLIKVIKQELGPIMVLNDRRHQMATLKELYDMEKNVIVAYGDKTWQARESVWLWPPLPQQWGNQQTLDGLISYLDKQIRLVYMKHYELWAMMAELTPTMFDILLNLQRSSLRFMADQVNYNITAKARKGYWNRHANIIAVDFIESTDLVAVAIKANKVRTQLKRMSNRPSPIAEATATTTVHFDYSN